MTGQAARDEEQRIDADCVAIAGEAGRKPFRGDRNTAQPIFVERPGGGVRGAALLDLDEGQRSAAPGDQVDLAAGNPGALGEDPPALQTEPPGGERFRPPPARFSELPLQSLAPSSSARA